jgi:hypothetical protein
LFDLQVPNQMAIPSFTEASALFSW